MRIALLLLAVAVAGLAAAVWIATAWLPWPPKAAAEVQAWTQLLQFLVALLSALVAGVGIYISYFTPFAPRLSVGATMWRIRPEGSPNTSIEIATCLTVVNEGARPGFVEDLAVRLHFPDGEWFLSPIAFVDGQKYMDRITAPNDAPGIAGTDFFSPYHVGPKSSETRTVLFAPFDDDADRKKMVPGVFHLQFYIRHSGREGYRDMGTRKIILEADMIERWKHGTTMVGIGLERPTDPRPIMRAGDRSDGAG